MVMVAMISTMILTWMTVISTMMTLMTLMIPMCRWDCEQTKQVWTACSSIEIQPKP